MPPGKQTKKKKQPTKPLRRLLCASVEVDDGFPTASTTAVAVGGSRQADKNTAQGTVAPKPRPSPQTCNVVVSSTVRTMAEIRGTTYSQSEIEVVYNETSRETGPQARVQPCPTHLSVDSVETASQEESMKSSAILTYRSRKNSSSTTSFRESLAQNKRWEGDEGDDQPLASAKPEAKRRTAEMDPPASKPRASAPTIAGVRDFPPLEHNLYASAPAGLSSPPRRAPRTLEEIPTFITTVTRDSSPQSVADSLTVDVDLESTCSTSLIKRAESVRARAESILMEGGATSRNLAGTSLCPIKSVGSSVRTEPTAYSSSSKSSRVRSVSEKIKRLQETKLRLQRMLEEHDDTSTILTESVHGFGRLGLRSPLNLPTSSTTISKASGSRMPGQVQSQARGEDSVALSHAKNATGSEGVLHILSMLEKINGWDLDVADATMDASKLNLQFLRSSTR